LGFAAAGADVCICARGQAALDATAADIRKHGVRAHAESCDLANKDAIAAFIASAAKALDGIDILVNNASGFGSGDDEAGWAKGLDIDVMATVRASNAALPHIEQSGRAPTLHLSPLPSFHSRPPPP